MPSTLDTYWRNGHPLSHDAIARDGTVDTYWRNGKPEAWLGSPVTYPMALADAVGASDAITPVGTFLVSLADLVGATDTVTPGAMIFVVALADAAHIADAWYEGLPRALRFIVDEYARRFGQEEIPAPFSAGGYAMMEVRLGETDDIRARITEEARTTFTVSSVTVTITDDTSPHPTPLRDDVAASYGSVSNGRVEVYYHETFSAANGYEEGAIYTATFKATLVRNGVTFVAKAVIPIQVSAAADE